MNYSRKLELLQVPVTINGKPAKIMGSERLFPTVASLDGKYAADWTWLAVERIVAAGGRFVL